MTRPCITRLPQAERWPRPTEKLVDRDRSPGEDFGPGAVMGDGLACANGNPEQARTLIPQRM